MKSRKRKRSGELITSQDIIFEILRRIPVKSLMRFKLACKYWNTFISNDSQFEELHSKTWIQKLRLLFGTISGNFYSTIPALWNSNLQENKTEIEVLQRLPFHSRYLRPYLINSSNALLLFKGFHHRVPTFSVYNCINGKEMEWTGLPEDGHLKDGLLLYDESTNMHKVLIFSMKLGYKLFHITSFNTKTLAQETGWRMIHSPFEIFYISKSYITIKGLLYWIWYGYEVIIQLFDIGKEKFLNPIRFTDKIKTSHCGTHLFEFRGSLGFMHTTRSEFQIWVLKDSDSSSWIQMQKVNLEAMWGGPVPLGFYLKPILVLENVKTLPSILSRYTNELYWYNMNDQKVRKIDVKQLPSYSRCFTITWVS